MSSFQRQLENGLANRYRIERQIGQGGMATVFLARDLKHDRRVALKVLHPDLAAALGAERFLAEIRTTANLQHPHILPLHDSGEADGFLFYVMPFVEGDTLRQRLDREQLLPIDDALRIARQVLGALDHAHKQHVIHRDIKPENILLLSDGSAVVADFGIALAVTAAGNQRMTQTGLSLGTPQYMSPEQAMGERTIDGRADIYAAGAVLYEMLTGDPPFTGATVQAIVAKVITERPTPPTTVRDTIPPHVEASVLRALAKLPADRFATAAQFGDALDGRGATATSATTAVSIRRDRKWMRLAIGAMTAAAVATGIAIALATRPEAAQPVERFDFSSLGASAEEPFTNVLVYAGVRSTLTPDGTRILYIAPDSTSTPRIWIRELGELTPKLVSGTANATGLTPSPDGGSIAFVVAGVGALRRVSLDGSSLMTLVPSGVAAPFWANDGNIYFGTRQAIGAHREGGLARVSSNGGEPTIIIDSKRGAGIRHFHLLPDGHGVLTVERPGRIVARGVGDSIGRVVASGNVVRYVEPGYLVYIDLAGILMGVRFDAARLDTVGPPVALGEPSSQAAASGTERITSFSIASDGSLLYVLETPSPSKLTWVTRDGRRQPVDSDPSAGWSYAALSPDGTRMVTARSRGLWMKRIGGSPIPFVTDPSGGFSYPEWSPDGRFVSYYREDSTGYSLWTKPSDGGAQPTRLVPSTYQPVESTWSPDGRTLVFRTSGGAKGAGDIYMFVPGVDSAPRALLDSPVPEMQPTISPNGKWLAYTGSEGGQPEVYVVPFPNVTAAKWQISPAGGSDPLWSRNGSELFFRDASGFVQSVAVNGSGSVFAVGAATRLFAATEYEQYPGHRTYEIARDGRFLMLSASSGGKARLVLVKGWVAAMKKKVGQ